MSITKINFAFARGTQAKQYGTPIQGVSEKKYPLKLFGNIFTSVKSFCVKFWQFVGSSYPNISTNFCRFIAIFHQMALIFPCQVLSRPIHPENENAAFRK